jgi:TonB family protein
MREAVSEILASRTREADGLSRMVLYSLGAHLLLVTIVALVPANWIGTPTEPEGTPMVISLSGSPGQDTGGLTQTAARRIQEQAPELPKERFVTPPAAKTPEMVLPEPAAKPAPKRPEVKTPTERSSSRKPTTGEEVRSGASNVETGGAAVPFGGLSKTQGGDGISAQVGLSDFCCPDYIQLMVRSIRTNWNQNQGASGKVTVKFVIRRDGALTLVDVAKPSNNFLLDQESRRAVLMTAKLPPLPAEYTNPTLTILLDFEYRR